MRPATKKALCAGVSLAILAAVWLSVDVGELWQALSHARIGWLALALLFFVPQKLLQAVRWKAMAGRFCSVGLGEALRLILAGDTLNLVLPSKAGDLSKALFLRTQGRLGLSYGLNLVAFEKLLDLSALCLLLVLGVVWAGRFDALGIAALVGASAVIGATAALCLWPLLRSGQPHGQGTGSGRPPGALAERIGATLARTSQVVGDLVSRGTAFGTIIAISVAIWIMHLAQIFVFFLTLNSTVPPFEVAALVPVAIFVGLLPVTIAGIGTRDAAMVFLFAPLDGPARIAGVALLTHLRYIVPGLAGLPFFSSYLTEIRLWQAAEKAPKQD